MIFEVAPTCQAPVVSYRIEDNSEWCDGPSKWWTVLVPHTMDRLGDCTETCDTLINAIAQNLEGLLKERDEAQAKLKVVVAYCNAILNSNQTERGAQFTADWILRKIRGETC